MNVYGNNTASLFEFDKVCERVQSYCRYALSRKLAAEMFPIRDREILYKKLLQLNELKNNFSAGAYFPDTEFEDFSAECNLLQIRGSVLNEKQLSNIRSVNGLMNDIVHYFKTHQSVFPHLSELIAGIDENKKISEAIDEVIDASAEVKNNASELLAEIRSQLVSKRRQADKKFRSYINELKKRGLLRDNEENFHNGRRVLSVLSEFKGEVKGIVHGRSDTGRTTFIEPDDLVELNNDLAELEEDEKREVYRLLKELTAAIAVYAPLILRYHRSLIEIDFMRAKARFAIEVDAHLPVIEKNSMLELKNAFHPLLYLQNKSKSLSIVPLNISLNNDQRIIVISGPNAGGKSIVLKTVGLMQLMLQSGLLVCTAENSRISFFNHFLCDMGDEQSIEFALSTYSSRLIHMKDFLQISNQRSLILIDEFGTGTDPELGGAIAEVMLEELNRKRSFGIITTHYTNIKILAGQLPGVKNASMLFEPESLSPKYILTTGEPGSSYTFEVAEKIGLPSNIINRAKSKVKSDKLKLNALLSEIQKQKNEMHQRLQQMLKDEKNKKDIIQKYELLHQKTSEKYEEHKLKRTEVTELAQLGRRLKSLIDEWEKSKDRKQVIKKFVGILTGELKRKAENNTPEKISQRKKKKVETLKSQLQVGSVVHVLNSKQTGVVEVIKKNEAIVNYGNMKMTVALENLELSEIKKV